MTSRPEPPIDAKTALDALDFLIVAGSSLATVLLLDAIGWKPRNFAWVGTAISPIVIGALALRRTAWPPRGGAVARGLTFSGLLATTLLAVGFILAGFGVFRMSERMRARPEPIPEHEVKRRVKQLETLRILPQFIEERPAHAEEIAEAGTFEDLMAEIERPSSPDELARYEAQARDELTTARDESFTLDQERAREAALRIGGLGVLALALGTWLDSRRRRAAEGEVIS